MWTELTVLSGFVDASHGATGQNLEVVADPNTTVEQLLFELFSDWMRTRTCVQTNVNVLLCCCRNDF